MRQTALAEVILSLVLPGDRARAAVGDLLEGGMLLWIAVLRIAGARLAQQWLTAPLRLIGEACIGWFVLMLGGAVLGFVFHLLWTGVHVADNHTGLELLTSLLRTRVPLAPPEWVSYWMDLTLLPSVIAWRGGQTASPQRGLATWTAAIVVWTFLGIAASLPPATLVLAPLALLGGMLRGRQKTAC